MQKIIIIGLFILFFIGFTRADVFPYDDKYPIAQQELDEVAVSGGGGAGASNDSYVPYYHATSGIDLNDKGINNTDHICLNGACGSFKAFITGTSLSTAGWWAERTGSVYGAYNGILTKKAAGGDADPGDWAGGLIFGYWDGSKYWYNNGIWSRMTNKPNSSDLIFLANPVTAFNSLDSQDEAMRIQGIDKTVVINKSAIVDENLTSNVSLSRYYRILDENATERGLLYYSYSDEAIELINKFGPTHTFAITNTGLVGIGTSNPAANLHVVGATYSSTNILSGGDIYTTGSGDDLWLGTSTQANANFQAYANGSLVAGSKNLSISESGDLNTSANISSSRLIVGDEDSIANYPVEVNITDAQTIYGFNVDFATKGISIIDALFNFNAKIRSDANDAQTAILVLFGKSNTDADITATQTIEGVRLETAMSSASQTKGIRNIKGIYNRVGGDADGWNGTTDVRGEHTLMNAYFTFTDGSILKQYGNYIERGTINNFGGGATNWSSYGIFLDGWSAGNGLTEEWAIWVDDGKSRFGGDVNVSGNYIHNDKTGLTNDYSVGECYFNISGGIIVGTNCTSI